MNRVSNLRGGLTHFMGISCVYKTLCDSIATNDSFDMDSRKSVDCVRCLNIVKACKLQVLRIEEKYK